MTKVEAVDDEDMEDWCSREVGTTLKLLEGYGSFSC
jgi:hypothetical protein